MPAAPDAAGLVVDHRNRVGASRQVARAAGGQGMREEHEAELHAAVFEGLLTSEEVEALREEALRLGRRPLSLLAERKRLSEQTLASLRDVARARLDGGPLQASTAGNSSPDRGRSELSTFPVPGWERYQPVRLLGHGGMGRVFLAFDPRLGRNVALKFVRSETPGLAHRFVAEAQAQARVDHERVCKVYEVGEVQGHPYIAMQYVDGQPLQALARTLTFEQKALLLAQVAEGVHAAHRAGIIHRDLKPSNILVERTADGQPRPYVMDFGLAREWTGGATASGTVLGTPHYMAPEQARGEVARLDRRADVYALGATLYALLTGQPPIPGDNNLEVLSRISTEEPRPPRALDRDIPVDLEAITLKCLEKDRGARYESARALAEDLRRFLDGEPVLARTAGAGYRLRKRARKHWRALSVAAVVLGLVAGAGVQAALARREALVREHLARRFSELAEHVEARARYEALARLHDTRPGRQALVARLGDIEAEMNRSGELARGPGHDALGRGWLALGDAARAREHLEAAWAHGYRTPRVAYALALALARLYQELLQATEALPTARRDARRRELAGLYREPALSWLRQGRSAEVPSTEYVEALLAYLEERHADALARLDALGERLPWFHEAPLLRGDVLRAQADEHSMAGRREQAQASLDSARAAYARAAAMAESLPDAHLALARAEQVALRMGLTGKGEVLPPVTRALESLDRVLAVSPDHALAHRLRAAHHRRLAEHRTRLGEDAEPLLQEALAAVKRALALEPASSVAWHEQGLVLWQWARYREGRGEDPRELLRQTLESFERVDAGARGLEFHSNLGLVFKIWADHEEEAGEDALAHRDRAIESFAAAAGVDASSAGVWSNLGSAYLKRAANPRAADVEGDLTRAGQALEKARALNPRNMVAHFNEGQLQEFRARWLRYRDEDARPALDAALAAHQRALALDDQVPQIHNGLGRVHVEQAKASWARGEDPLAPLALARRSFDKAREVAPRQLETFGHLALVHVLRATYLQERGGDAVPDARAALQAARAVLERQPADGAALVYLGQAHQLLAAHDLSRGRDPRPALALAEAALGQALRLNPRRAEAWHALARVHGVRARWHARSEARGDTYFDEAARAWLKAIESSAWPLDERLAFARACQEWAAEQRRSGREALATLRLGLTLVDEVLTARPGWPKARSLRASLLVGLGG